MSYVSARGIEPKPSSFLNGLRAKWSGIISSGYFVEAGRLAGRGDAIYMMEDSLWIVDVSFGGFYDSIRGIAPDPAQPGRAQCRVYGRSARYLT